MIAGEAEKLWSGRLVETAGDHDAVRGAVSARGRAAHLVERRGHRGVEARCFQIGVDPDCVLEIVGGDKHPIRHRCAFRLAAYGLRLSYP